MGHIHIRKCLNELEKVFKVLNTTNRDLTDEEQYVIDNFGRNFAEAMQCDIDPDWCQQIINNLSDMMNS